MRLILASLALSSLTAMGQVKIRVSPPHPKKYETVHASVENTGSNPITFCIEVGQTSPKEGGETESTPWPFWVQRNNNGKWGTLMIAPTSAISGRQMFWTVASRSGSFFAWANLGKCDCE